MSVPAPTPGHPTEDKEPHIATSPFQQTEDTDAPAILPETGAGQAGGEGKVRAVLGLLKKLMGVSDVANLRLSLPASLLEPIPNLEYWQYGDRPDFFAAIGDSPDEFDRMLSVLRFSFSKELKFVRARIGKPYNSALGEHFRCHWNVPPALVHPVTKEPIVRTALYTGSGEAVDPSQLGSAFSSPATPAIEMRDDVSVKSIGPSNNSPEAGAPPSLISSPSSSKVPSKPPMLKVATSKFGKSGGGKNKSESPVSANPANDEKATVVFLCEQIEHHPPISAAYYGCPSRGVQASCVDQISAKVSGMTIQVTPGAANKGIFIDLTAPNPGAGESYHISQPTAQVNGILKGQYYGTIADKIVVTASGGKPGKKLRAIVEYKDESWIGKARFELVGIIFSYNPDNAEESDWAKIKQVPLDRVVANIEGVWRKQIKWRRKGDKDWKILIDIEQLDMVPKSVRPLDEQHEMESRRLWDPVTIPMVGKNFNEATRQKQIIEQRQRDRANALKAAGDKHTSSYFAADYSSGAPVLSDAGKEAVASEVERASRESTSPAVAMQSITSRMAEL